MGMFSKKYAEMMHRYAQGEFGDKKLSLAELLKKSGNENLFDEATLEELEEKQANASGMYAKMAWSKAIDEWKRKHTVE